MEIPFVELPVDVLSKVFSHLDVKELGKVACVCSRLRRLAYDSDRWKVLYCEHWGLPSPVSIQGALEPISTMTLHGTQWRDLYVEKEAKSNSLRYHFNKLILHGHTSAIRAVKLLPEASLICSGGFDSTVRLWNLEDGLLIACSDALSGEAIRSIALDTGLLVVGCFDSFITVWPALRNCPHLFDIAGSGTWGNEGAKQTLHGHTGRITCVGLDSSSIYSGSQDKSIRVWSRFTRECVRILKHGDMVWALVLRGGRVLSTAGSDAYSWETETGTLLRVRRGVHSGYVYAVEGTRSGHVIFTAGEDGVIRMFDDQVFSMQTSASSESIEDGLVELTGAKKEAVASWEHHRFPVYSLAFDYPWLISASGDGYLSLMDMRQIMKPVSAYSSSGSNISNSGGEWRRLGEYWVRNRIEAPERALRSKSPQRGVDGTLAVYCVDISSNRVAYGGEGNIIQVLDFL